MSDTGDRSFTAAVFTNGGSQAVRLPREFRVAATLS